MKKIISLFLTLALCVGLFAALGVSAFADDDVKVKEVTLNVNNPEVDGVKALDHELVWIFVKRLVGVREKALVLPVCTICCCFH